MTAMVAIFNHEESHVTLLDKNRATSVDEGRAFAPNAECWGFEAPVGSSQRLKNWYMFFPWLVVFTI